MEEQVLETLSQMGAQLALLTAKGTAVQVNNKVQAIRNKKQIDELCNSYEEVINELVAERAQAIALANAYQAELNRYEITDEDILHLQATIENALNILRSFGSDEDDYAGFEQFKSLISVDTLKAMQLLGFDYKKAIGDPLTKVCAQAIENTLGTPPQSATEKSQEVVPGTSPLPKRASSR